MLLPEGAPIAPDGYDVGTHPGLRGWYSIQGLSRAAARCFAALSMTGLDLSLAPPPAAG